MKKKLTAMLLAISICIGLSACDIEECNEKEYVNGFFIKIDDERNQLYNYIVYDEETKVKYYVHDSGKEFAMVPLYNADGSLQLYEGE